MNPAAGVLAPAPGRLISLRIRRLSTADRIKIFAGRLVGHRPILDLVLPLALLSLVSTAGTVASPVLLGHPLLLIALSPRLPFLLLGVPSIGLVPFVVVGSARLCLADPFHYRLGRRLATSGAGGAAAALSGRSRRCRWARRLVGHRLARPAAAVAVLVRPNGRHLALAGAVGLPTKVVVVLDLVGTALYLAGLHGAATLLQ